MVDKVSRYAGTSADLKSSACGRSTNTAKATGESRFGATRSVAVVAALAFLARRTAASIETKEVRRE